MRFKNGYSYFKPTRASSGSTQNLRPGEMRGESALNVRVAERRPIKAWLEYNNFSAPAVGSNRVMGTIAHQNLLGFGDALSVQYGQSLAPM